MTKNVPWVEIYPNHVFASFPSVSVLIRADFINLNLYFPLIKLKGWVWFVQLPHFFSCFIDNISKLSDAEFFILTWSTMFLFLYYLTANLFIKYFESSFLKNVISLLILYWKIYMNTLSLNSLLLVLLITFILWSLL